MKMIRDVKKIVSKARAQRPLVESMIGSSV